MKINDIRLLNKKEKKYLVDNFSAEFAYVLSRKIGQPVYCAKRNKDLKYFVEYFNVLENQDYFNMVDLNRIVSAKSLDGYSLVNLSKENLDNDKVLYFQKILTGSFKKYFSKKIGDLTFTYFVNEIYQIDLPFRRDILVVKRENLVVATCYITGLNISLNKVRKYEKESIEKIIEYNSDCKRMLKKYNCVYQLMESYLNGRYEKSFIDSVIVKESERSKGICTEVYKILFEYYNNKEILLTSCKDEIQSNDALNLWEKIKNKYPDKYKNKDGFSYLDYRK